MADYSTSTLFHCKKHTRRKMAGVDCGMKNDGASSSSNAPRITGEERFRPGDDSLRNEHQERGHSEEISSSGTEPRPSIKPAPENQVQLNIRMMRVVPIKAIVFSPTTH